MECEQIIRTFLKDIQFTESCITGFLNINDLDSFLDCMKACGFSFYKRNSIVYETSKRYKSSKIRFSYGSKIPFFGSPFIISKTIYMRCSQDGEYKQAGERHHVETPNQKKRVLTQPTKKMGCKAFLHITYLLIFRSINVQNRQGKKREASEKIKTDLAEYVKHCETQLLVELSAIKKHNHPPTTENQIIHPLLKSEIYRLVANNISSIPVIKSHLLDLVKEMIDQNKIPQPDANNHCFYPPNEVIRYHIYMAKFSLRKEYLDESTVSGLIDLWKGKCDDKFYFQPSSSLASHKIKPSPLFCHQTKWQEHLLNIYGNTITILDSAYETTGYNFPLYFLVVKTNQSFIVVGTFVLYSTQECSITEALNVFREWNPNWYPKYWVCGHTEPERSAVQTLFPSSVLNICSHRTQQTWRSWLLQEKSIENAEPLLNFWKALMFSKTEDEFSQNELQMQNSDAYKSSIAVESYFYKTWYPLREKWVLAYQTQEFYVYMNMNNGSQNGDEFFSYEFLNEYDDKMLSNILTIIIEHYLPHSLYDYRDFNTNVNLKPIPDDFVSRPINVVEHVIKRYKIAEYEFRGATIVCTSDNKFMLKSPIHDEWYHVDFEDVNCTCDDFQKWRYPCIHMCSVFVFTEWNFSNLANWYLDSSFMKLDEKLAQLVDNLPIWYFNKRKPPKDTITDDILEEKKTLIIGDIVPLNESVGFVGEIIQSTDDNEEDFLQHSLTSEWVEECDPLQIKKQCVRDILKSMSDGVDLMSEEDLNKCYLGLKNLQNNLTPSTSNLLPL